MKSPEGCHIELKSLKRRLIVHVLHVQELDGHIPVPVAGVHSAEPPGADLVADLEQIMKKKIKAQ